MEQPRIRRLVTYVEDIRIEGGRPVPRPLKLCGVAAIAENPWAGRGLVEDLSPQIDVVAPALGRILTDAMLAIAGSAEAIEAYGKSSVVGMDGEIEHAAALIHTLRFGNVYRDGAKADTTLCFTNTRGGPNCAITIPLMHKHDPVRRSHYLTLQFSIADAPAADEIVVALGAASGGRPHHRIGDRRKDLESLGGHGD